MTFTRDNIQGFIDGFVYAGGDPKTLNQSILEWLDNHPIYKAAPEEKASILSDVSSYRVSAQTILSPSKIALPDEVIS